MPPSIPEKHHHPHLQLLGPDGCKHHHIPSISQKGAHTETSNGHLHPPTLGHHLLHGGEEEGVFAKLNAGETVEIEEEEPEVEKSSYAASTLLPGFIPTIKKTEEKAPSITAQADKAVAPKQPIFADAPSTRLPGLPVMPKVEEKPAQEPIKEEPIVATEEVKQTQLPFVAPPAAPEKPAEPAPVVDEIPGFSTTMIPGVTPPAPVTETPVAAFTPIEQPPVQEAQPEAPKKTESNANNSGEMSIEDMFA